MDETLEARVAQIAKEVFERQIVDPNSMFRLVLQRELFNFGQQMLTDINTKIDDVVAPLAKSTNVALSISQNEEAKERLKRNAMWAVQIIGGTLLILASLYGAFKFFQTH